MKFLKLVLLYVCIVEGRQKLGGGGLGIIKDKLRVHERENESKFEDGEDLNPGALIMGTITAPTGTMLDEEFISDAFIQKRCYSPDRKD